MSVPPGGTGEGPTAQQYLQDLHFGQGLSYADIARRLGRSPRLLGFVARGQKPGRTLVPALRELSVTGAITAEPARRVAASGQRARIRSRAGAVVPPPPRGTVRSTTSSAPPIGGRRPNQPPQTLARSSAKSAQQPDFTVREPEARNTFRQVSDVNDATQRGNHSLQAPKARWSYNRWAANNAFAKIAADAARLGLRLHAAVHVEIGTGANRRRLPRSSSAGRAATPPRTSPPQSRPKARRVRLAHRPDRRPLPRARGRAVDRHLRRRRRLVTRQTRPSDDPSRADRTNP